FFGSNRFPDRSSVAKFDVVEYLGFIFSDIIVVARHADADEFERRDVVAVMLCVATCGTVSDIEAGIIIFGKKSFFDDLARDVLVKQAIKRVWTKSGVVLPQIVPERDPF